MKKLIATLVAAVATVAFAGLVVAAEPAAQAMPAGHPPIAKEETKAAKPAKKVKKAKKAVKKDAAKAAEAPAAPAAPAAK